MAILQRRSTYAKNRHADLIACTRQFAKLSKNVMSFSRPRSPKLPNSVQRILINILSRAIHVNWESIGIFMGEDSCLVTYNFGLQSSINFMPPQRRPN